MRDPGMGTRRNDPERKPVILSVEPLEERFLLSGGSLGGAAPVSSHPAHSLVAGQQNAQPQKVLVAKGSTAGPSASIGQASSLPAAAPQYPSSPAVDENALRQLISSALLHASASPTAYQPDDDDDDSPAMEHLEGYAHSNQVLVSPGFFANQNTNWPDPCCAILILEQGLVKDAGPHLLLLNLLSTAGLGSAATPSVPNASLLAASENGGEGLGKSPMEEAEPLPETSPPSPPSVAPPAEEKENSPPAPILGCPFADGLPIDVGAIQRSADAFFEQIAQKSEEWQDSRVFQKLIPWFAATSMAAYYWVRLRRKQACSGPRTEENWGPDPRMISD